MQKQTVDWRSAVFVCFLWFSSLALCEPLFSPPTGFWLTPVGKPQSLYGPTRPDANWRFSQWNNPDGSVIGFDAKGVAQNKSARIAVRQDGYSIRQSGSQLACGTEFDAFAAPNNGRVFPEYPSAATGVRRLADVKKLVHRITVRPVEEKVVDLNCKITQAILVTAIVLNNEASDQRFFYQLRLRILGRKPTEENWWARGANGRYGVGDNLSTFGLADAEPGRETTYEIDLAGRIKELIRSGSHGIDPDVSRWTITSHYHGQAIWGNVTLESHWRGFSLVAH